MVYDERIRPDKIIQIEEQPKAVETASVGGANDDIDIDAI